MTFFTNLKLAVRLGIAFGALVVALAITAALSLNGLGKLDADADELSNRDVAALLHLVALSEDFLATDGDVLRHLYVEDGFLEAQDKTAAKIEDWNAEAEEALAAIEPKLESERAKATMAEFTGAYEEFVAASGEAVKLSRQETVDGVEERDGSRNTYTDEVRPVLEGLDGVHDRLEDEIAEQAAAPGRRGRRHGCRRQAHRPDRRHRGAADRARARLRRRAQRHPPGRRPRRPSALAERELTSRASRTASTAVAGGDLTIPVAPVTTPLEVKSTDEIGELSRTFNDDARQGPELDRQLQPDARASSGR